ncbi:MAG: DUF116 domain-containing protein [Thermodesulfobacteriota bacterium]
MKGLSDNTKWSGSAESIDYRPGKGVFLAMLGVIVLAAAFAGFFFWYIPTVGLRNIHPALPYALGAVLLGVCAFVIGGTALITLAVMRGSLPFYSKWLRWMLVKFYLPLMIMAGGILRIPKIKIERVFIDLNNQMVKLMGRRVRPERLLILMPHCIQFDDCKIKVTRNVRNCAGCGKCEIGKLLDLSDRYGVSLFISTGGTVARRKVVEERPDAVIAVACERDLTSGLQDSYPLPVWAIVNKRPHGYCMETGVDLSEVSHAIAELAGGGAPA